MVYTFKLSDISAWSGVQCEPIGFAAAVGVINMILNTKILWFRILAEGFTQNFKKLNWGMDFGRNSNFMRYCLKFYGICAVSK